MLLTKTVEESDYKLIESEVRDLKFVYNSNLPNVEVGHEHRFWEYGMALKALTKWCWEKSNNLHIVDIGSGDGLLGPTLMYRELFQTDVESFTEIEPRQECIDKRFNVNLWLQNLGKDRISIIKSNLGSDKLKGQRFDAVFCISVIEHVADDHAFLRNLSELVAPGGLLFMTTDVMPIMPPVPPKTGYHFDNLRAHNYTTYTICKMLKYLDTEGFRPLGEVNLEYKGNQVFDYSFCSIAMVKQ